MAVAVATIVAAEGSSPVQFTVSVPTAPELSVRESVAVKASDGTRSGASVQFVVL